MKIETKDTTIDVFPIRKVRISHQCEEWPPNDDFHRVCQDDITYDRAKAIGMNQQQSTLVLNHMRQANTDVMGNGKDFFMMRGNTLIPIYHYSFSKL